MSIPMPFEPIILVWIMIVFLFAGTIKGVVGLGLPTVSLGLLVASIGLEPALALVVIPAFITNIWQAFGPGFFGPVLKRTWLFMLVIFVTIPLGTWLLTLLDARIVTAVLGLLVGAYAVHGLTRPAISISQKIERPFGIFIGFINGLTAGMTSSALPGIIYLQAIGLKKDQFIQALGIMFVSSSLMLTFTLSQASILTWELALFSLAVLPSTFLGMHLGQKLRNRLPEEQFRKATCLALGLLGLYLAVRSILALI